ncbi:oxoglutarate dehydrogenase [Pyrenochaeta sp. DS3sAY3a]|nr:oxoglutarate dehydrogenase [Pyrenochaeta sp. DS3sAY3a]
MYRLWKEDRSSVHGSWQAFFQNIEYNNVPIQNAFRPPPGLVSGYRIMEPSPDSRLSNNDDFLKAQTIVQNFQEYGHLEADINPLGSAWNLARDESPRINDPHFYGMRSEDLDRRVKLRPDFLLNHAFEGKTEATFREIFDVCNRIYCSSIGAEIHHLSDATKKRWIQDRLQDSTRGSFSSDEKKAILRQMLWATNTEKFLAAKFPGEKRFGLDGAEALGPAMDAMLTRSVDEHGIRKIVIGSCHRGRMNLISNVYGGDHQTLLRFFAGAIEPDPTKGETGDVKYHFGVNASRITGLGNKFDIDVLPNPSHLECISPVAQGKAKATQDQTHFDQSEVLHITTHGDAAFSGQGPVYETLNLARLSGYEVGGTIRLVVNNQIGFTTDAQNSRSTLYCTDIAKYIEAPVLHVNGDDPDAVVFACRTAADWRAKFKSDIMIDFVCYRRFGHNEIDQASFTQPNMYTNIDQQKPVGQAYAERLISDHVITQQEVDEMNHEIWNELEVHLVESKTPPHPRIGTSEELTTGVDTASDEGTLRKIMDDITVLPEEFTAHRNLVRILQTQKKDFEANSIGWNVAESLAFGTLLAEGHPVRLSGQDVERGTFSQRHSVLVDQVTNEKYTPLNSIGSKASYTAINSPLSEFAVLGFDYGYSLAASNSLVMWEAQFGDFANNAQVIIDQFISSGEAKWGLKSGVVLSLPHGYDGQGPEHSSARIGRFLELCNGDVGSWIQEEAIRRRICNIQVVNMTTPANYFHVLRRQARLVHPKPLIIFFSKSLLRHPLARSSLSGLTGSSTFQPVLMDPFQIGLNESVTSIILCSGQVFAALHKHREAIQHATSTIVRVEELHPFPYEQVTETLNRFPNAEEVVWCQEEPFNGGMWHYMRDRLESMVKRDCRTGMTIRYAGRSTSAATATGSKKEHVREQEKLVKEAFNPE